MKHFDIMTYGSILTVSGNNFNNRNFSNEFWEMLAAIKFVRQTKDTSGRLLECYQRWTIFCIKLLLSFNNIKWIKVAWLFLHCHGFVIWLNVMLTRQIHSPYAQFCQHILYIFLITCWIGFQEVVCCDLYRKSFLPHHSIKLICIKNWRL